jgi:hypothetical protein
MRGCDTLHRIPVRQQPEAVVEYLRLARQPRVAGDNFSPLYYANTYLREFADASNQAKKAGN